jgi:hypothetical protein
VLFERAVRRSLQPLQANGPKVDVGFPRRDSPLAVASLEDDGALSRWTLHGGCFSADTQCRCGEPPAAVKHSTQKQKA